MKLCPNCKSKISDYAIFCPNCKCDLNNSEIKNNKIELSNYINEKDNKMQKTFFWIAIASLILVYVLAIVVHCINGITSASYYLEKAEKNYYFMPKTFFNKFVLNYLIVFVYSGLLILNKNKRKRMINIINISILCVITLTMCIITGRDLYLWSTNNYKSINKGIIMYLKRIIPYSNLGLKIHYIIDDFKDFYLIDIAFKHILTIIDFPVYIITLVINYIYLIYHRKICK